MTTQNTKPAFTDIQSLFNLQGSQDVLKKWAGTNERMAAIFVEAGTQSVDIMSKTSKEALSNLREVTQVRNEPAEYGKAYSDYARKQIDLLKRTAQDVSELTQKAGTETAELASKAGDDLSEKVVADVKRVAEKATVNVKDATDKVASNAKDTEDKADSAVKKSA